MLGGDQDKAHDTALVIGAKDVLVATHGEKRGTAALAARLDDADVSQMSERLAELSGTSTDDGMSVNGFPVSGAEGNGRGSFYVGLGPPEGAAARTALIEAIRAAKAQSERRSAKRSPSDRSSGRSPLARIAYYLPVGRCDAPRECAS